MGHVRQPRYHNAVIGVRGSISPAALLRLVKRLERGAGRRLGVRWGPRALDIDILDFGGRIIGHPARETRPGRLILPHPGIQDRGFVLVPLAEAAPHWRHPILGVSAQTLLDRRPALRRGIVALPNEDLVLESRREPRPSPAVDRPRIYLAGPEEFWPDALSLGRKKCRLAASAGFEGVFPLDQTLDLDGLSKLEQARRISLANEALMRTCDLLIANLTPFRGASMDAGTAFEVGFMRALGRPVLGYTNTAADYKPRAAATRARGIPAGDCDGPGVEIEDFDLAENLMIEIAIRGSGGTVVRSSVAAGTEMTDLDGFRRCLDEARRIRLAGR